MALSTLVTLFRLAGILPPPPRAVRRQGRSGSVRDFQRTRVYRWEQDVVFPKAGAPIALAACRALVEQAYRWAERPAPEADWAPPLVTDGRGRRHACGSREVIKLPRWARTPAIVLHECAHGLADDRHGPRFVTAYVALLEAFAGLDAAELRSSLAARGVSAAQQPRARRRASPGRHPA